MGLPQKPQAVLKRLSRILQAGACSGAAGAAAGEAVVEAGAARVVAAEAALLLPPALLLLLVRACPWTPPVHAAFVHYEAPRGGLHPTFNWRPARVASTV